MQKYLLAFLLGATLSTGVLLGINAGRESRAYADLHRVQAERDEALEKAGNLAAELDRIGRDLNAAEGELREANQRIAGLIRSSLLAGEGIGDDLAEYGQLNKRFGDFLAGASEAGSNL